MQEPKKQHICHLALAPFSTTALSTVEFFRYMKIVATGAKITRIWANARDGRPVEYRWRPLFNPAKFG